jgi:hypothetical protein
VETETEKQESQLPRPALLLAQPQQPPHEPVQAQPTPIHAEMTPPPDVPGPEPPDGASATPCAVSAMPPVSQRNSGAGPWLGVAGLSVERGVFVS